MRNRVSNDPLKENQRIKIRPKWGWNRYYKVKGRKDSILKSDQNGVEIPLFSYSVWFFLSLKSDQNGVEIITLVIGWSSMIEIKIRPKWGWNSWCLERGLQHARIKIRPKWGWNLWVQLTLQTFGVGLKSDQNGVEIMATLNGKNS